MKRVLTIIFALSLFAGIFVLLGFIRQEHNEALCTDIRIAIEYRTGDTLISQDEIRELLEAKFGKLEGKSMNAVKLAGIIETITAIPYIDYCDVDFMLNGTLRIRTKQRIPILRVFAGNHSWYIDEQGIVMPRHDHLSARVPVASGYIQHSGQLKTGNNLMKLAEQSEAFAAGTLSQIVKLARYIQSQPLVNNLVEQIYVNAQGEIELFTHVGSQRILFGNAENIESKFNRLIIFYKAGPAVTGLDQYKTINLKYNHQVLCSKI